MKRLKKASMMAVLVLCMAGAFLLAGCAGKGPPQKTNCDAKITWEVVKDIVIPYGRNWGSSTALVLTN